MTVHFRWVALGLTLMLAACAGGAGKSGGSTETVIERRAMERWNLLIAGDYAKAYEYFSPGYRSTRPVGAYVAAVKPAIMTWRSVDWRGVECDTPDSCEARFILHYTVQMPSAGATPGVTEVKERWVRLDGRWYHLPQR